MVRHTDMDMIVIKEEVYTYRFLETGDMACHTGPHREVPGKSGVRGNNEKAWVRNFFFFFFFVRQNEQGRANRVERSGIG